MRIYRIEHKEYGIGPYRDCSSQYKGKVNGMYSYFNYSVFPHQDMGHPTPSGDSGIKRWIEKHELCGFATKKQLISWFSPDELKYLIKNGFRIRLYEAQNPTIGEKQAIFEKDKAILLFSKHKN